MKRWGLTKPPISLKPHCWQGPWPCKLQGMGSLPLARLSFGLWVSTWGLPALPACPAANTCFPSVRLGEFLAFCKPLEPLERFLPVLLGRVARGSPGSSSVLGVGGTSPLPGHSPCPRGREGWAEPELLAPGMASSPAAAPSRAGRTGLAGLDAASVFFPCLGLSLSDVTYICTPPELLSGGFGVQTGEGSSSLARPSCTGTAHSAEHPPGWLPEETWGRLPREAEPAGLVPCGL